MDNSVENKTVELNKLTESQKETIELNAVSYLESIQLVPNRNNRPCCKCDNKTMNVVFRKRDANSTSRSITFRCSKCRTFQSIFEGTMFSMFQKLLFDIIFIIKCWSLQLTISKSMDLAKQEGVSVCRQTLG